MHLSTGHAQSILSHTTYLHQAKGASRTKPTVHLEGERQHPPAGYTHDHLWSFCNCLNDSLTGSTSTLWDRRQLGQKILLGEYSASWETEQNNGCNMGNSPATNIHFRKRKSPQKSVTCQVTMPPTNLCPLLSHPCQEFLRDRKSRMHTMCPHGIAHQNILKRKMPRRATQVYRRMWKPQHPQHRSWACGSLSGQLHSDLFSLHHSILWIIYSQALKHTPIISPGKHSQKEIEPVGQYSNTELAGSLLAFSKY